jgi:hypothetical protein
MLNSRRFTAIATAIVLGGVATFGTAAALDEEATGDSLSGTLAATGPVSSWVPIEAYRAFDSRTAPGDFSFQLSSGGWYYLNVTVDEDNTEQIPLEATGVTFNATVVQTEARGFLQVAAPDVERGSTSTVNWIGDNVVVANSGSVQLGAVPISDPNQAGFCADGGCVLVYMGGPDAASADWLIDITGYYVAN